MKVKKDRKLLIDTMMFEPVKSKLVESADGGLNRYIVTGVVQRANAKNQNGRVYPKEVLAQAVNTYIKTFVNDRRAFCELDHPECHRPTAEILTEDGWKFIKDVSVGERVLTLNTGSNCVEYQSVQRVINEPYSGKMVSLIGKGIDALVTPNHRFVVNDRYGNFKTINAQHILDHTKTHQGMHMSIPSDGGDWVGVHYDTFTLDGVEVSKQNGQEYVLKANTPLVLDAESWFSFLGFYLAEGYCANRDIGQCGYEVSLTQNEGETSERFREVIKNLSTELKWNERSKSGSDKGVIFHCSDPRLWSYVSKLGNKYTKYVPNEIKNASKPLLQNLFEWYLAGDGTSVTYKGYKRHSIFSVSKKMMEDFQEILLKLGVGSVLRDQISTKDYVFAGRVIEVANKVTLHRLWLKNAKAIHLDFRFLKVEEVDYDDTVHCVTVPNGIFYCRDHGKCFWSGNSSIVEYKNTSHVIRKMWWKGNDVMAEIEILPTPSGNIARTVLEHKYKLGISSRALGSTEDLHEGVSEVQDDLEFVAWDFVTNPSTQGAFLNKVNEGVSPKTKKTTNKYDNTHRIIGNILCDLSGVCKL